MPDTPAPSTAEPLIAVIDDETAFAGSLAVVLRSRGFRVQTAGNATDGWALLQRERPAAILCDINMPGIDGVDLFSRVRADRRLRGVPFLFISGLFTPEEAEERTAAAKPGTYYLAKPLRADDLTRRLREAIARGLPGETA